MFAWIILLACLVAFALIFARRMLLTRKDVMFQDHLAEEQKLAGGGAESKEAGGDGAVNSEVSNLDVMDEDGQGQADEKTGRRSLRQLFAEADTHFSRGRFVEAEPIFLEIIEVDGGHLDAHHKLGMLHMKMEDFGKAELYFSKLVNLKKDPIYFSNLGAALYRQQRLVEAAEAYENAIALDAKRAARLQSLAQVYFELGDDEKALKYFELAARRKPKDVGLKMLLAEYYDRLERFAEAAAVLEKFLEMDPYNKEAKAKLKTVKGKIG